jgi:phosphoadenosine phosphosulfate reductase
MNNLLVVQTAPDYSTFGKQVDTAIKRIQTLGTIQGQPLLAFSGGKDSTVLKHLAERAGIPFDAHYHVCGGVDMPEAIQFTRQYHPDVVFDKPPMSMRKACLKEMAMPNNIARFCCRYMKESQGKDRTILQGIRWAESVKRSKRVMVERCQVASRNALFVSPIIDWSDKDVWFYIHENNLPYCSLYDEGKNRIGCVMCPMQQGKGMRRESRRWPRIAKYWQSIFEDVWQARVEADRPVKEATPQEWFEWWQRDRGADEELTADLELA